MAEKGFIAIMVSEKGKFDIKKIFTKEGAVVAAAGVAIGAVMGGGGVGLANHQPKAESTPVAPVTKVDVDPDVSLEQEAEVGVANVDATVPLERSDCSVKYEGQDAADCDVAFDALTAAQGGYEHTAKKWLSMVDDEGDYTSADAQAKVDAGTKR